MFSKTHCLFKNLILIQKPRYFNVQNSSTARLFYALKQIEHKAALNTSIKKQGFYVDKNQHPLSVIQKNKLFLELEDINYFNSNQLNQAAIIQTQFAVHKIGANFKIYPCQNQSPFDEAYELLIEARPVLSSIVVIALMQLLNIDEFKDYAGMVFSIVLLKYSMETYLKAHKDDGYLYSLMTTLQAKNMVGSNCLYKTNPNQEPGSMIGEFSDSYYKIVDNRANGVFHDAHIKTISPNEINNGVRYVLIAGIKNHFCQHWTKPSWMRSENELLPQRILTF